MSEFRECDFIVDLEYSENEDDRQILINHYHKKFDLYHQCHNPPGVEYVTELKEQYRGIDLYLNYKNGDKETIDEKIRRTVHPDILLEEGHIYYEKMQSFFPNSSKKEIQSIVNSKFRNNKNREFLDEIIEAGIENQIEFYKVGWIRKQQYTTYIAYFKSEKEKKELTIWPFKLLQNAYIKNFDLWLVEYGWRIATNNSEYTNYTTLNIPVPNEILKNSLI